MPRTRQNSKGKNVEGTEPRTDHTPDREEGDNKLAGMADRLDRLERTVYSFIDAQRQYLPLPLTHNPHDAGPSTLPTRSEPPPDNRRGGGQKRRQVMSTESQPRRRVSQGKFNHYTPLTTTQSKILEKERNATWVRWPGKIRGDPKRRDRRRFCKFHDDHGHDTDECFSLKDMIEFRIREGHLGRYIEQKKDGDGRQEEEWAEAKEAEDNEPKGVIYVTSCCSNSAHLNLLFTNP